MLRKVHRPRGLNLRDSDINRPPEYASDLRNVEKNSKGELIKRWGVDDITLSWTDKAGNAIAAKTIIDLWEYVGDGSNRELLALVNDGLYRFDGTSVFKEIPNASTYTPNWTVPTKPVEYNRVLYWNDADATKTFATSEFQWKYDGGRIHRSGSPAPKATSNHAAGALFGRLILETRDVQGNNTSSAFTQFNLIGNPGTLDIFSVVDSYYDGFVQKYGTVLNSITVQTGAETIDVKPSGSGVPHHNFEAGDLVLAQKTVEGTYGYLEVASVTDTTVTFTGASIGTLTWNFLADLAIDRTYRLRFYVSDDEFFGYRETTPPILTAPSTSDDTEITAALSQNGTGQQLTEVYDDSFLRVLPPKALYWTTFRNHLVCARMQSAYAPDGTLQSPFATTADNTSPTDNIVWSDFPTSSNGATVETYNPGYVYAVGVSEEGPIEACHGNDDSLAVHKTEQTYYVYGDFISATLTTRKTQTASIGAAAHRSIEDVDGGHVYVADRGVYASAGGQLPIEVSDIIEPLFRDNVLTTTYDLKNANSLNDFYREKIYFYLPYLATTGGDILVYDYYYKEWFIHDNLDCDGGFTIVGSDIYLSDGTGLRKRNLLSTKDGTKRIRAYYTTGWFDLDEPVLRKKFIRVLLMSMGEEIWQPTIRTQCDWVDEDINESVDLEFSENISLVDDSLPSVEAYSIRLTFRNTVKNESLLISGYEIEFETTQAKPKGQV